jgi:hypothetical protein
VEVAKITTKEGRVFYADSFGPDVMREVMKRCDWVKIEQVFMTHAEYNAIPATNESAELFRPQQDKENHVNQNSK